MTEAADRNEWERMRVLAAISIQPHIKKTLTPNKLLPLPWDKKRTRKNAPKLTKQEAEQRYNDVLHRLGEI